MPPTAVSSPLPVQFAPANNYPLKPVALVAPPPPPKPKKIRQSSLSILDPETGERKYICAVPKCNKQYKNVYEFLINTYRQMDSNIISFTLTVMGKEFRSSTLISFNGKRKRMKGMCLCSHQTSRRPYECSVDGCDKKYKNLNGLKVWLIM